MAVPAIPPPAPYIPVIDKVTPLRAMKGAAMSALAVAESRRKQTAPILDQITATALASVGYIKTRAAYSGNCCQVRRVSDSAILDIPFLADGIVDTDRMIAFAGTSDLALVRLYDHSGNGNDFTQTTAGNQPLIDLIGLRSGCPSHSGGFLNVPAGVSITSTANCAVWKVLGVFSNRLGQRVFDLGATTSTFALDLTPISAFSVQPAVNGATLNFGTMQSVPNTNGCVIGLNSAAGGMTLFRNNYSVARAAVAAVAAVGGTVGSSSSPNTHDDRATIIFNTALSANDAQILQYGLSAAYNAVIAPVANVILQGDSRLAAVLGRNLAYTKFLMNYLPSTVSIYSVGKGGDTISGNLGDQSQYVTPVFKAGMTNVFALLSGVNDIRTGVSAATMQGNVTTWVGNARTAGGKVIVATMPPYNITGAHTSAMEAQRVLYNAWLRANTGPGKLIDALFDPESEATFLPNVAASDYPDNLHEGISGYRKEAPLLAAAIVDLIYGAI